MPRKPKSRKPNNTKKNKQRGRKVASKKRECSKVKGGAADIINNTGEQKPLNLNYHDNYSGDEEDLNQTGETFAMPKIKDADEIKSADEVETPMKFNPPKKNSSKAGIGIGAVALVGGAVALLMLAN